MALKDPAAVHDTTETIGTGSYNLLGGDPTSRRSLADAVTNGDAANGDTVWYYCSDDTTGGATALDFEWGIGTISSNGAVLSRDTIYQSSNGGAKVSWGSGGTRDIVVSSSLDGLPKLASANTWAAVQTFSQTALLNAGARLTNNFTGRLILDNAGIIRGQLYSTTTPTVRLDHVQSDGSTVDTRIELGNTNVDVTGVLRQGGTAVALQGVLSAPSGMRIVSFWTTVPTGWAVVTSTADKTILTTETAAEGSTTGGSWTISGLSTTVNNATVTVNDATLSTVMGVDPGAGLTPVDQATHSHTTVAHGHTASTTAGSAWRPAWIKGLILVKS